MAKIAELYPDEEFVQQVVAQIPWGHNIVLMDKFDDENIRKWYIKKSIENGWSRNVLIHQIESGLYERQKLAGKISNFETRLSSPQSELAVQTMKDPYIFDLFAVDDIVKTEQDNPSIGLLLCKSKNNVVAEYSLRDMSKPIGVSEYKITSQLPETLEKQLPSV